MNPPPKLTETEFMQSQFAGYRDLLLRMNDVLSALQTSGTDAKTIAGFKDGLFCCEVAMTFYEEANRALQAGAWFAAASIASSALESLLLSKCFFHEAHVKAIPTFQKSKRSHKADFGQFARSLALGTLLEIADDLGWFPKGGVPQSLVNMLGRHLDENALACLKSLFDGTPNVGQVCAKHVRECRNLLHPAVCLKQGRQPSKDVGMTATLCFLIAFMSLAKA